MVTASDMRMHHVLMMLTLTFIQDHTDLNHENNKCVIYLDYSSNAYQVCSEDSPTKGPMTMSRTFIASQTGLLFNLQYLRKYVSYEYDIQTWHDGRLMHGLELDFENICKACPFMYILKM